MIDISCGSGYGSAYLLTKHAHEVIGCDISREAVKEAVELYEGGRLHFVVCHATQLPFRDGICDVVVSIETIEHIAKAGCFLQECKRIVRNGGKFVCSTPNKTATLASGVIYPYHVSEYTADQFCRVLGEHFTEVQLYGMRGLASGPNRVWRLRRGFLKVYLAIVQHIPGAQPLVRAFYLALLGLLGVHLLRLRDVSVERFDDCFPELEIASIRRQEFLPSHIIAVAQSQHARGVV